MTKDTVKIKYMFNGGGIEYTTIIFIKMTLSLKPSWMTNNFECILLRVIPSFSICA